MTEGPPEYVLAKQIDEKIGTNSWNTAGSISAAVDVDDSPGMVWLTLEDMVDQGAVEKSDQGGRNGSGVRVDSYRLKDDWEEHVPTPSGNKQKQVEYWGEMDKEQDTFGDFA